MKKYDFSKLTRMLLLARFFRDYEDLHSASDQCASELAEREHDLAITDAEWSAWRESQEKAEAQF